MLPMRRLSRSDIQFRPYLHVSMRRLSSPDIQYDLIYIWYHDKTQLNRYTIPTLSKYVTKRSLSQSDIKYWPYLHMLPRQDVVDQIYNTDPIYRCYPWEDSFDQIYNSDPIYIYYHERTRWIKYTIPALSTYCTMGRLSRSDIQYRPYLHILPMRRLSQSNIQYRHYLHMLPWEDSVNQIYNTDPIYIYYPWEDSVNQIYNTDPIYICYHEKTQ